MTETVDLTEGHRIYAIGDIHGCLDLLNGMMTRIETDLAARPHPDPLVIFLGDYVDRGPDVRGVIETLIGLKAAPLPTRFLLGNHDSYIRAFLDNPDWFDRTYHWLHPKMGGNVTLASYGVPDADWEHASETRAAFAAALPTDHLDFINSCELLIPIGGYVFAHAGIRPGVPLEAQERDNLIWIREPFLSSTDDLGVKVVHGHTIVPAVEHHANRIAVDTGAFRTGILSCVVLEGDEVDLLTKEGLVPLPAPRSWRNLWLRR